MTATVELARIAAAAVPPVGATGVSAVVDHEPGERLKDGTLAGVGGRTRFGAAWVIGGRRLSDPIALLDRQRDAYALVRLLDGTAAAPRSARHHVPPAGDSGVELGDGPTGAPTGDQVDVPRSPEPASAASPEGAAVKPMPARLCERCGRALPPGSRPQRRTCSGACRVGAARERRADVGATRAAVTVSGGPTAHSSPDLPSRAGLGSSSSARRALPEAADPSPLNLGLVPG